MIDSKTVALALATAAGAWVTFGAVATGLQRRLVFGNVSPTGIRPTTASHRTRSISLSTPDGVRLAGWLLRPRMIGPHPAVLYFGGREDDVAVVVRDAAVLFPGMVVLAMNYRGYGNSRGKPGERQLIEDARMLFEWLAGLGFVDGARIALVGRSLGTGVAVQLATEKGVRALVLVTPYDSLLEIAKRKARTLPVRYLLRHRFESVKYADKVQAPTYIMRAQTDNVVPSRHTDRLAQRMNCITLDETVPNTTHGDIIEFADAQQRIAVFLTEQFELVTPLGS